MYQVFIVTCTGYYTAIQGSNPTDDLGLLEELTRIIEKTRSGKGRWYDTIVARVTPAGTPVEEDRQRINEMSARMTDLNDTSIYSARTIW
jgi:hypothetical protein